MSFLRKGVFSVKKKGHELLHDLFSIAYSLEIHFDFVVAGCRHGAYSYGNILYFIDVYLNVRIKKYIFKLAQLVFEN